MAANRPKRHAVTDKWLSISARQRLLACTVLGIVSAIMAGILVSWTYAPLAFWDVAAFSLMGSLWIPLYRFDPAETQAFASREDPGRASADALLVAASVASLAAVAALLVQSGNSSGAEKIAQIFLGVLSVFISWAVVHSLYALRYADLYYEEKSGVDFNMKASPTYADFAYLAFTIGMTYQVSDTSINSPRLRRMALKHALLSYLFGTAIIAVTINFVAGLGK